ncbi:hypothetical protein BGZ96_011297 [Linnemannia gamsii]|uniref:CCHC-type domain-containing protein n=1 Tax=Linnemannia gamsii TaxID=64522 RepID=A0ABQ7JSQ4_9FUNG|nr:hypothetical protein BGZ96_011297 [Linnemannia gamsii]
MPYNQITTATATNPNNGLTTKGNRMHPYLNQIHQDMCRTYEALQAQIQRSRMQSIKTLQTLNNNNDNINLPSVRKSTVPFSAAMDSLLNQFSDYQATQVNSFQQLTASLLKNNNNNNNNNNSSSNIDTSPAGNSAITANLATMGTSPLSPASGCCPLDLLQDESASSLTRSMSLNVTEVTTPGTNPPTSNVSADASSSCAAMHHTYNDQPYSLDQNTDKDKDMDMDMDITPLKSNPTIVKEAAPTQAPLPTDSATNVSPISSSPSFHSDSEDTALSSNNCTIKPEPTSTDSMTPTQPTNCSTGSILLSSSSAPSSKEPSTYQKSKDRTPSASNSTSLLPSPMPSHIPAQLKLLSVKYNADNNLTLPDFVKQLQEVFDHNPAVFRTDADRIKYALRSMGMHTSRYFEPFLNKSVPDSGKCLKSFTVFLKTLEDRFGEPPSLDAISSARAQLLALRQASITMCNYIMIFQECAAIVRWEEDLLKLTFVAGISPEVSSLLGNSSNFLSLSMLQVAAAKAYSVYQTQSHSRAFEHQHPHSTFDQDLEQAQELLRQQNWRIHQSIRESMGVSIKTPPPTFFTATPTTTVTESNSAFPTATATINAIAKGKATAKAKTKGKTKAEGNVVTTGTCLTGQLKGTYFKSHVRGKLTEEEKQYRTDNNLCWYCAKEGHGSFNCPNKSQNKKNIEH